MDSRQATAHPRATPDATHVPAEGPAPLPAAGTATVPAAGRRLLGVLGGMGPLAGTDFVAKLVRATPASADADHIPVLLWSVPQVPDRLAAMEGRGESPVPMLVDALRALAGCGVVRVAIACNTAHHWYDELVAGGGVPILHIADAAARALSRGQGAAGEAGRRVALLATRGTHAAEFYPPRLAAAGHRVLPHDESLQGRFIDPAIEAVKACRLDQAGGLLAAALDALASASALAAREGREDEIIDAVLLGCTELPIAHAAIRATPAAPMQVVDATQALAEACVQDWFGAHPDARAGL
jgi:aspartate racemase